MLESNNHVERWSGTVHRVYLCVCVCVLRVFSRGRESDDRDRREAANNVPEYRGGTTRYDRFVRSPETKRFLANGAHLSFRGSLRMLLRRKPTLPPPALVHPGWRQVGEACTRPWKGGGNVLRIKISSWT